jgi:hypothetical protein
MNFVDINEKAECKAWAVLFHFKNKSTESLLYEEFKNITGRNTGGKTKHHEAFTQLFV